MQTRKIVISLIACATPLFLQASRIDRQIERRVKDAIDSILRRENLSAYRIKQNLSNAYDHTVQEATTAITELLKLAGNTVFKEDLKKEIKKIIDQKFRQNNLSTTRIPGALTREYNRKCKAILKKMQDKMWYNGVNYVTKENIADAVDSEIDYHFIQRIKDETSGASYNLFDSISDTWNNFLGNASSSSSSSSNTSNTTGPEKIYYEHKCPVCITEYQTDERVGVLNCGHCFHSTCIKQWLQNSKTCPICRKQNVYLAKIYDSKEKVPGYKPQSTMKIYYTPDCRVCLGEYQTDERVGVLNCGHCFHSSCIKQWLKNSKTCPLCRKQNAYLAKIYNTKEDVPKR
jgi:hypothetical protein